MGKKNTFVSIIIPTFNRARTIKRAIESVLNQNYKYIEILVIDDGSTDNTEYIVKEINSSKIRYIKSNDNKGVSAARNTGIENAVGEYIVFLDSDDVYEPSTLPYFVEIAQKDEFCEVFYGDAYWDQFQSIVSSVAIHELCYADGIPLGTAFIKKDFLLEKNIRFNEHFNIEENWLFFMDCIKGGAHFTQIARQILKVIRETGDNLSQRPEEQLAPKRRKAIIEHVKKYYFDMPKTAFIFMIYTHHSVENLFISINHIRLFMENGFAFFFLFREPNSAIEKFLKDNSFDIVHDETTLLEIIRASICQNVFQLKPGITITKSYEFPAKLKNNIVYVSSFASSKTEFLWAYFYRAPFLPQPIIIFDFDASRDMYIFDREIFICDKQTYLSKDIKYSKNYYSKLILLE